MKHEVINLDSQKVGDIDLADEVFAVPVRPDILQRTVVWQLAKRRAGTHKAKHRGEVSGTGRKMYRQKGTGRARHGSAKVGLMRGGGKSFGPVVRGHAIDLPKRVRRLALRSALSAKLKDGKLVVLDEARIGSPKTKELVTRLRRLGWESALIVGGVQLDENFLRAAANIAGIDVLPSQGANVYDILRRDTLVLTREAVAALEARLR
ncbi:MAG: 50S ribosomal protein L4 [Proteobacteria bacterium]|nr:50S ribosomal protein L4 [Pseudomonadota bacterium]